MTPELPLRDIHLPAEPSWWPPAPGWWLLAALAVAALSIGIVLLKKRLRFQRHRQALLAEVDHIWARHPADGSGALIIADWSQLLRRACLRYQPGLATREGLAWSRALGIDDGGDDTGGGLARLLIDAPFRPAISRREAEALREPVREALRRLIDGLPDTLTTPESESANGGRRD